MKQITSRDNPDYRDLLRVLAGKRRPGERGAIQEMALEGVHLCEAWLQSRGQPEMAFFDEGRIKNPELAALYAAVEPARLRTCPASLLQSAGQTVHGQGVIFLCAAPALPAPERLTRNCLWLDRIQDPGNMGTLIRTAAAAGIKQVFASRGCVSAWSPKVLRSGQGAHFVLDIYENQDLRELAQRRDIPLLATTLERSTSLYEAALPADAAWLVGNEGQGVDTSLLERADLRVHIPQEPAVESLNVAIAAAICLFEQRRQHMWNSPVRGGQ